MSKARSWLPNAHLRAEDEGEPPRKAPKQIQKELEQKLGERSTMTLPKKEGTK